MGKLHDLKVKAITGGKDLGEFAQEQLQKLPLAQKKLDNIDKVIFVTKDGRQFAFFNPRVWRLNMAGNIAYQIRGDNPAYEEAYP
jgi:NACalpha-BTF3-like transcription factor